MKKLTKLLLPLLMISFFAGCNSSSSYSKNNEIIPLINGVEIEVNSGDSILPQDEDTRVEVRHALDSDKKYVTLLSGSADLIKGNYETK